MTLYIKNMMLLTSASGETDRMVCRLPQIITLGFLDNEPAVTNGLPISSKFGSPGTDGFIFPVWRGCNFPWTPKGPDTGSWLSQINSWQLTSKPRGPDTKLSMWTPLTRVFIHNFSLGENKSREDVCPFPRMLTYDTSNRAPWPQCVPCAFSCKLLAYKFPNEVCSFICGIVNLPELSALYNIRIKTLSFFLDEHSLCFPWSHHCNLSEDQQYIKWERQQYF